MSILVFVFAAIGGFLGPILFVKVLEPRLERRRERRQDG